MDEEIKEQEINNEQLIENVQKLTALYEEQMKNNLELHKKVLELSGELESLVGKNLKEGVIIHSVKEEKEISLTAYFKNTSPRMRIEFAKLDVENSRELLKLKKEWDDFNITNSIENMTEQENVLFYENKEKKQGYLVNQLLRFFKMTFDDRQNPTSEKALLRADFENEFYQNINLEEVQKFVISFRLFYRI